jgi:hypothetical protein
MLSRAALLACLLALIARPAAAQDEVLETAKQHFDAGQNLYLQGKYIKAADEFMAAYKAKPFPAFLFNAAVCYEKNRDFGRALELYDRFLEEAPHSPDRKLVVKRIEGIRQHLSPALPPSTQPATQPTKKPPQAKPKTTPDLPPVKTKGLVVIESEPSGAAIYLEDKKNGIFTRTPYTGTLSPGKHTVIVELKGYKTGRKNFTARPDRMAYLFFGLSREHTRGWIEVKANVPGADVYVDRKDIGAVGRTPYSGWLKPGEHTIIVEREGYKPITKEVSVKAGEVHDISATLRQVEHGWLKVTGRTTRGSRVLVDGNPVGCESYPCRTELAAGTYEVEVERDGYKSYTKEVTITQASETRLAVRLNAEPSRLKAYVTFSVAAVLLGGGIASGIISNNREDSLEQSLSSGELYDSDDPRILEGKITSVVANSLFALSGAVAGLGLYYLLRDKGPDSYGDVQTENIALTPSLAPGVAGLSGTVRF